HKQKAACNTKRKRSKSKVAGIKMRRQTGGLETPLSCILNWKSIYQLLQNIMVRKSQFTFFTFYPRSKNKNKTHFNIPEPQETALKERLFFKSVFPHVLR